MMEKQVFGAECGEAVGLAKARVEIRPQIDQGVSLMGRRVLRFKSARGSISSGTRRKASPLPIDRLASRKILPASPENPPKATASPEASSEVCAEGNKAGGAQRQGRQRRTGRGFLAGIGTHRNGKR